MRAKGERNGGSVALALAVVLSVLLAIASTATAQTILFTADFESGDLSEWPFNTIDSVPPILTIESPSTPVVFDALPAIEVAYADDGTGINLTTLSVLLDGAELLDQCVVEANGASCIPRSPLAAGDHEIEVSIRDVIGNGTTVRFGFEVVLMSDDQPPTLELLMPSVTTFYEQEAAFQVRFRDFESGVDIATLALTLDGASLLPDCTTDEVYVTCDPRPLTVGRHELVVSVADEVGNLARESFEINVLEDVEPPELTLVAPDADATMFNEPSTLIVAMATDTGIGVDAATLQLEVDGLDHTASCDLDIDLITCGLSLPAGLHEASLMLSDRLGNRGQASVTFNTIDDTVPPQVFLDAPPLGLVTDTVPVIEARFEDPDSGIVPTSVVVRLDGADITATCGLGADTATCTPARLEPGVHHVTVSVDDLAGNGGQVDGNFTLQVLDEVPPSIAILEPTAQVSSNAAPEVVLSLADDDSGVDLSSLVVLIDDHDLSASCSGDASEMTCTSPTLLPGSHSLRAQVLDTAGNLTIETLEFDLTLALPLTIDAPAAGTLTRDDLVDVSGLVDPSAETVEIGDIAGTIRGDTFSVLGVPLEEGSNALTVVARAADGGVGMATVTVVRDTTPPRVMIVTPTVGLVVGSPQLAITGEVSDPSSSNVDNGAPVVRVNGVEATVEQRAFMVPDFLLQPGENVITVVAEDDAGNQGTFELRVTFDEAPEAKIEEMLGNGQSVMVGEATETPLIVRLVDGLGQPLVGRQVDFSVSRGGGSLSDPPAAGRALSTVSDDMGFARMGFTVGRRSGSGGHEITVSSVGIPGAVVFCLDAVPGPAARIKRIRGDNQLGAEVGLAGQRLPNALMAQVFDAFGNPVSGVDVTFQVIRGGGDFDGQPFWTARTDVEGQVAAGFALGPEPGTNNNLVQASFDGLLEPPAIFTMSAAAPAPESETSLHGQVLDNVDQPVPGVTLTLGDGGPMTTTNLQGDFAFAGIEPGAVTLHVDGSTTSLPGVWPSLSFEFIALAGQANSLGKPLRILPLDAAGGAIVGGDQDVTLSLAGVPGAELTVFAHSVTFPDGATEGTLTFTQVHNDKVPMEPPLGSDFMLAWTVQPSGTAFDPPARISIPNGDLGAGSVVDIFSFDHDVGEFVPVGTARVTEDGSQIVSNPGFGVVKAGWHGCLPPPPPTGGACSPSTCTICPPGGGPPEPKCGDCARCDDGVCDPESIDEVTCEANGSEPEEEELVVGVDQEVDFRAIAEGDCGDRGYEWSFGDGESQEGSPTASHAYEEEGEYNATITVTCECGAGSLNAPPKNSMSATMRIRVVKVDLEIQALPEEDMSEPNEEAPGGIVVRNNDDDDENETPDLEDDIAMDDDELIEVKIFLDESLSRGETKLEATDGGNRIKVWKDANKSEEIDLPKTWDQPSMVPEMVFVEGFEASDAASDVELTLEFTPITFFGMRRGEPIEDKVKLTVIEIDADVDTNNDRQDRPPARTQEEDKEEDFPDRADKIGKMVVVNTNNDDSEMDIPNLPAEPWTPLLKDSVPDFADGFDRDPMHPGDDVNTEEKNFVPLVIELSKGIDVDEARLRFKFEESSPTDITTSTPNPMLPEIVEYQAPTDGMMRIWTKKGNVQRDPTPVGLPGEALGGDRIVADPTWFFASELGFSSGTREVTFYIEAIQRSGTQQGERITVELDPDGDGDLDFIATDTVRVTNVEVVLRDGAEPVKGGEIAWITGTPTMPQLNVRLMPTIDSLSSIRWGLETTYTNNVFDDRTDQLSVPIAGLVTLGAGETWDLVPSYPPKAAPLADPMDPGPHVFFGGDAILKARVGSVYGVGFKTEMQFRIRGENPDDLAARTFIDANDTGAREYPFAYAIGRSESQRDCTLAADERYNQFEPRTCNSNGTTRRVLVGGPIKGPPEGYGMFQNDLSGSIPRGTVSIHRLWHWQANLRGGIDTFDDKWAEVRPFINRQRTQAMGVDPPVHTEANCTFDDSAGVNCGAGDCNYGDALTIKAYNGVTACASDAASSSAVSPHFAAWDNRSAASMPPGHTLPFHWDLNVLNNFCFNYVNRICREIGEFP